MGIHSSTYKKRRVVQRNAVDLIKLTSAVSGPGPTRSPLTHHALPPASLAITPRCRHTLPAHSPCQKIMMESDELKGPTDPGRACRVLLMAQGTPHGDALMLQVPVASDTWQKPHSRGWCQPRAQPSVCNSETSGRCRLPPVLRRHDPVFSHFVSESVTSFWFNYHLTVTLMHSALW